MCWISPWKSKGGFLATVAGKGFVEHGPLFYGFNALDAADDIEVTKEWRRQLHKEGVLV